MVKKPVLHAWRSARPRASWHHGRVPRDPKRGWVWVAPAEWPTPPEGFYPAPGWKPEPEWPATSPSDEFWRRTKRGVRLRRLKFLLVALAVAIPGACTVAAVIGPPCFFDPPPGDQLSVEVLNDSTVPVAVVDCLSDTCTTAQSRVLVPVGARGSMPLEGCAGGTMGVLDPATDGLTACIAEPTENSDSQLRPVAISEAKVCARGLTGQHVRQAAPP
jgi:hypothetical protein